MFRLRASGGGSPSPAAHNLAGSTRQDGGDAGRRLDPGNPSGPGPEPEPHPAAACGGSHGTNSRMEKTFKSSPSLKTPTFRRKLSECSSVNANSVSKVFLRQMNSLNETSKHFATHKESYQLCIGYIIVCVYMKVHTY